MLLDFNLFYMLLSWNTVPAFEEDTFISEEGTYEDSADEDQDQQPDDIVSDGEESDQEPEEQEPEDQIPDSLKVEVLDAEIKKNLPMGKNHIQTVWNMLTKPEIL